MCMYPSQGGCEVVCCFLLLLCIYFNDLFFPLTHIQFFFSFPDTIDNLFGSCQNIFTRALTGEPRFKLEEDEIVRLGKAITVLVKAGFTWKDAFTQCTLQNTLVEFARRRLFDPTLCKDALSLSSEDLNESINDEIAAVLLNLLDSGEVQYINDEQAQEDPEIDGFNSNKRDEIVQVHKYFDKSKGQLKRDPYEAIQKDSPYQYFYSPLNDGDEQSEREDSVFLEPQSSYDSKLLSGVENVNYPAFATDNSEDEDAISKSDIDSLSIPTSEDALEVQSDQETPEALVDPYQSEEDGESGKILFHCIYVVFMCDFRHFFLCPCLIQV